MRQRLRGDLHFNALRIFPLSALDALQAGVRADGDRLAASGLPPFQAALVEFLTTEKAKLSLTNLATRTASLVARERRDLRLGRLQLDGGPDPETVDAALKARLGELDAHEHAMTQKIAGRIEADLPDLLAARSPAWQTELRELLAPRVEDALSDASGDDAGRGCLAVARERIEEHGRGVAGDWLSRRAAEVHELLLSAVADEIGTLLRLARFPGVLGAELAGLALPDDRTESEGWSPEDIPTSSVPRVEWSVVLDMPRRPHIRATGAGEVRRRLLDGVDAAITSYEERAREGFSDAARSWLERFRDSVEKNTRASADRFRRELHATPREQDLAMLDELAERLATFRAELDTWDPDVDETSGVDIPTEPASHPQRGELCVVCERMEATLSERLRHDQFRLATSPHEQVLHAQGGGFCRLHTWAYAAMASPVGISAGYARLAESLADTLDSVADGTVEQLADRVAESVQRSDRCPVCAALAESERSAVTDVASETLTGTLCLRHVSLALAAGPAAEHGRAMVSALSAALRRNSEDMRAYALKRAALHSGLLTDEESEAYLHTLHLLSGQSALVRPGFQHD